MNENIAIIVSAVFPTQSYQLLPTNAEIKPTKLSEAISIGPVHIMMT
ncbi:hypothetical protein LCGC14_0846020 [marine sediment metagenome]|uniref:Uncharacterized protein n=1 Tax=marine sediment metagenome TaxID=412755 RepID=A0A0F9PGK5_9ZZZZ